MELHSTPYVSQNSTGLIKHGERERDEAQRREREERDRHQETKEEKARLCDMLEQAQKTSLRFHPPTRIRLHPPNRRNAAFGVVTWEQRGAGRSYRRGIPRVSMTVAQFVRNLEEVVKLVKERFCKDKVVLLAHSWGPFSVPSMRISTRRTLPRTWVSGRSPTCRAASGSLTTSLLRRPSGGGTAGR